MSISFSCCVAIITKFCLFIIFIYLKNILVTLKLIGMLTRLNGGICINQNSQFYQIYLCISATSTSSERLFSDAGNMMTAKRTSLNQNLFERMVVLKKKCTLFG